MSLFDLFRAKAPNDDVLKARLVQLVMNRLTDRTNRIRAEDALCAAATIVAERCIDAAGDYPLRDHDLPPGQRTFSDRANELLCGETSEAGWDSLPTESTFGQLRAAVNRTAYQAKDFPDLGAVVSNFAAEVGKPGDWGKVPLTVPPDNHPLILPLQFGYETRPQVDAILKHVAADKRQCLHIAVATLAELLNKVAGAIAPEIALRLAVEIANGMAKTAPMTDKAMRAAQAAQSSA